MSLCINPSCSKPQNPDNLLFCETCGSGLLLQNRYRVVVRLGGGGFGDTFEINEVRTNKTKVLKVLTNNSQKAIEAFKQEAEVLSQLNHPSIPKVEPGAYFEHYSRNSKTPIHCFVMEKIEGENLHEYMKKNSLRPINQTTAIEWLKDLLIILEQVHNKNFFHRDIKPSNVMLRVGDTQLVLIDFGTVREVTNTVMIQQGGVTGFNSPGYTPSEQLTGNAVKQSDFFALGRTFVYLLTGKEPLDQEMYDSYHATLNWRNYAPQISFYFGESITPELVNYDGNYSYASAPKGQYRQQTTDVGTFPPNAFGLYDMHGNLWEWCQDDYKENYTNAPIDGSALTDLSSAYKLLRGGSWYYSPVSCRSACRNSSNLDLNNYYNIGFRVVCSGAART
ncbi:MAG: bifunctional serine/threonine-protein kinase/formylglycine-generating enzyme family protein [Aphanizomenon gracile PMC627.10]|nr:bifunctional serine/threonine-protein kinase/formylglycine-generating enzyme family protein [Aphanizomenon gracile PMC627.10]